MGEGVCYEIKQKILGIGVRPVYFGSVYALQPHTVKQNGGAKIP